MKSGNGCPTLRWMSCGIVSILSLTLIPVDSIDARGKAKPGKNESQFIDYCESEAGSSATDPDRGKYYCCLHNDEDLLGDQCVSCDVDTSGNKSNCETSRAVPSRFEKLRVDKSDGTMAPPERTPGPAYPRQRIDESHAPSPVVHDHRTQAPRPAPSPNVYDHR